MNPSADFFIFRDSRRQARAADVVARLQGELRGLLSHPPLDELLSLLLLGGEMECVLADAEAPAGDIAAKLTDLFADAAITCDSSHHIGDGRALANKALPLLQNTDFFGAVSISAPEGFAYYALHPLDYADLIARLQLSTPRAFVVGIRSIGTTLSGVVCAKLRQLGTEAERLTVRPTGHPYERQCELAAPQRAAVAHAIKAGAEFLVCDEGPGRSGSSLLSVAEALETEGVPRARILILCAYEPDADALCAPDAARRWRRYRSAAVGITRRLPSGAAEYAGGGEWRRRMIAPGEPWPAVWPQMERLKYLSADCRKLFTFEGYGPYGAPVRSRNEALSASGFGAHYIGHYTGFGAHSLPPGRAARRSDLTPSLLAHMAEYCAWRAREFRTLTNSHDLAEMVRTNFAREFGEELDDLELGSPRPAICDNRMAPQYWWLAADGRWLKFDAAIHGDDHFFPGPCDIAWDLAGAIVEWELTAPARDFLVTKYRDASGDDPVSRLPGYELAYATFRLAWSKMAAASAAGTEDEERLPRDYRRYRRFVQRLRADGPPPFVITRRPSGRRGICFSPHLL